MTSLREILSPELLQDLAGDAAFRRGKGYFASGAVGVVKVGDNEISAQVEGSDTYRSRLFITEDEVDYDCTCPVGDRGECCKHVVALGLTWLTDEPETEHGTGRKKGSRKTTNTADLRAWLAGLKPESVVDLLHEAALNDDVLYTRLMNQALTAQASPDVPALKTAIRNSFATHGFMDYRRMRAFVQRAMTVPELLGNLCRTHPAEVAELALYAMRYGIKSYENLDDSDGSFGDIVRDVAMIHLEACREARPDGVKLARTVFKFQLQDDWVFFAFEDYAPLLGESGVAEYRKLAETAWQAVPSCGPKDKIRFSDRADYFAITRIMEELEQYAGDTSALVAVKAHDLSSPYHYLQIAELLREAGRETEALEWAERGLRDFAGYGDDQLVAFLLKVYDESKRYADAAELAFRSFRARPMVTRYRQLHDAATKNRDWQTRRRAAWQILDEKLVDRKPTRPQWESPDTTGSLRVEILLWEKDVDNALGEAKAHGCSAWVWRQLAAACEMTHSDEAVRIYQSMVDGIVDCRNNNAYAEAAELTEKIGRLMQARGESAKFDAWRSELKTRHRQKRNFMKALDALEL